MTELILTRGLPASGKSSWAREWVQEDPASRVRVNRDELRAMLYGQRSGLSYEQEQAITAHEQAIMKAALRDGKSVVVDAMHLRARYIRGWAKIHPVTVQDFNVPVEELIDRDEQREHRVGAQVIEGLAAKFLRNGELPALPDLTPEDVGAGDVYVPDPDLPEAIIVDIDGTLAHMAGRSPYDYSQVHTDTPDEGVRRVVQILENEAAVIVVSGRDGDCREQTESWLGEHMIPFDELHMRDAGDKTNDALVKRRIFDEHIRHRFNVVAVIDDRNRVVRMWRDLGLKCLQAQEGDF